MRRGSLWPPNVCGFLSALIGYMPDFLLQNEFSKKLLIQGHWTPVPAPMSSLRGLCTAIPFTPECLIVGHFCISANNLHSTIATPPLPPHNEASKMTPPELYPLLSQMLLQQDSQKRERLSSVCPRTSHTPLPPLRPTACALDRRFDDVVVKRKRGRHLSWFKMWSLRTGHGKELYPRTHPVWCLVWDC